MAEVSGPDGVATFHLDDLEPAHASPIDALVAGQLGDPTEYGLRLQSLFLQHAYRFDPRAGLSNARIEPQLHQVYVAHVVANKLQPRMILADEVGLGKTIEAGLILKELRARGIVDRVLVVCPASLQYQWQSELRNKFNEEFEIIDGAAAKYLGRKGANPFLARDNVICSLPFASNEKRAEKIIEVPWDLVIFDEAHRVRRWMQSANKTKTTKAYDLADELKELSPGLLLLTATPMQLHHFELYSLIELVEPGLYPSFTSYERARKDLPQLNDLMRSLKGWRTLSQSEKSTALEKHRKLIARTVTPTPDVVMLEDDTARERLMDKLVDRHPLAGVMVRNRKAEIGGFSRREAKRVSVTLTDEELELYRDVTRYIQHGYDLARSEKQNAVGFLMVTYQKMLASSAFAIRQSLRKRLERLRAQARGEQSRLKRAPSRADLAGVYGDIEEISQAVDELEGLFIDYDALEVEIAELETLIDRLGRVTTDSKASTLLDALDTIFSEDDSEKVVIFTQFIDTQMYLKAQIEHAGYTAAVFNGRMNLEEKENAIRQFRERSQVLISTESGGEGRNLQFSHLLVNYDHPWNPMKVEQRIGRLDRIGQRRPVFIYNLACAETVEARVLDVLENRIRLFEESVGSLDPILGEVESDIEELIMEQRDRFEERFEQFAVDIERRVREAQENERILADFALDRASLRRDQANELLGQQPLASHRDLERFIASSLDHYGGTLMPHSDGGVVITLSPKLATKLRLRSGQTHGVFDPSEALEREELPFFALGNDLIDRLVVMPEGEGVSAAAYQGRGRRPGQFVEIYYEIRSSGPENFGLVTRHRVDQMGRLEVQELRSMPELGASTTVSEVPSWVAEAVEVSRTAFAKQVEEAREQVRGQVEERREESRRRAERIYGYRRDRLQRQVDDLQAWIAKKELSGSERDKKILPAQRGRLRKTQERLIALREEYEQQLDDIDRQQPHVVGTVWGAALVEVV